MRLVLPVVLAATCLAGSTSSARLASNRLASNRLASNRLASNRLASNRLSSNKLDPSQLDANDLVLTADGRDVLSYLIGCALPADVTLHADVDGQTYDFPGNLGLAPRWVTHRLSGKDKRWISACMLARINAHDTAEAISLRGPNAALTVGIDEAALYTVVEGSFYGNIFTKDPDPIIWIACRGEGQAMGEFGGLVDRDCTEPDPVNPGLTQCGFTSAGDCADYTPAFPSPYACEDTSVTGGYYEKCHDAPGVGKWPHTKKYKEVITTFVTP